jgi:hypothetical protein
MTILRPISDYFSNLDRKQFIIVIYAVFGTIILLIAGILFFYYRSMFRLKKEILQINQKRTEVQQLLERSELVQKQQVEVDAILAKEKDFKISQFFEMVLQKASILQSQTQPPTTASEDVLDNYTQWTLDATIKNINMKKLTELLDIIEQNERVFTKELEISRASSPTKINVRLVIATLEQKEEITA